VNAKLPLSVNIYPVLHELFVIVPVLFNVIVASTFPLVAHVVLYAIVQYIQLLSIVVTVAVALPVFPAVSMKLNVNIPLSPNV
jgi:hypothetical protein